MCPNESWPEVNSKFMLDECLRMHFSKQDVCMRINITIHKKIGANVYFPLCFIDASCTVSFSFNNFVIPMTPSHLILKCSSSWPNSCNINNPQIHPEASYHPKLLVSSLLCSQAIFLFSFLLHVSS